MNSKHLRLRIRQCLLLATSSNCPRRKFGAILVEPTRNVVVAEGYNGGPRGGSELCGIGGCLRNDQGIPSGERVEVGCVHAEMNAICNAAAQGATTRGTWLFVNGEPCLMCAKLIHHAGITRVVVVKDGYSVANGVSYLLAHGVPVDSHPLEPSHAS